MSGSRRALALAGATLAVGCTLSACQSEPPTPPVSTSAPTVTWTDPRTVNVNVVREAVPAGISPPAGTAVEAWFDYWEQVGVALERPEASPPLAVSTVASGAARSTLDREVSELVAAGQRRAGTIRVGVTSAAASATTATVCGPVRDDTVVVGGDGRTAAQPTPAVRTVRASLVPRGPSWSVDRTEDAPAC